MKILLSGAHGLIGSRVEAALWDRGDTVTRIVSRGNDGVSWSDIHREKFDLLEGFDAVINLGAKNIGEKRWSLRQRQQIWDSRVVNTQVLAESITKLARPPKAFLCASAIGYYGNTGDEEVTESHPKGSGFLADLCEQWEAMTAVAREREIRVVNLRSGIVQASGQGALNRQAMLYRFGLGGRIATGQQWVSWIHIADEVRAILHVLDTPELEGPVNLCAPQSIRNREQNKVLSLVLRRPAFIPVQTWMLYVALGRAFSKEMLLSSCRVVPEKLQQAGFVFRHPTYLETIVDLLAPNQRAHLPDLQKEFATFQVRAQRYEQ